MYVEVVCAEGSFNLNTVWLFQIGENMSLLLLRNFWASFSYSSAVWWRFERPLVPVCSKEDEGARVLASVLHCCEVHTAGGHRWRVWKCHCQELVESWTEADIWGHWSWGMHPDNEAMLYWTYWSGMPGCSRLYHLSAIRMIGIACLYRDLFHVGLVLSFIFLIWAFLLCYHFSVVFSGFLLSFFFVFGWISS